MVTHHVMVAGWTLCMGSQSTCWSPTDPSPPVFLTCQHINLPCGSCSAMTSGHVQASSCCTSKAHQRGLPPAHQLVLSATAPRDVPRPPLLCEGFWLEAWQGGCTGRSRNRTWMWPGDGSNGRRAEFGSWPHLQLLLAAPHGEDRVCGAANSKQLTSSTHVLVRQKKYSINILALHFSTNAARAHCFNIL